MTRLERHWLLTWITVTLALLTFQLLNTGRL